MEGIVEKGILFDYYGCLLTERQQQIYEDAVSNDLSLSELADAYQISRQGVHDLLRRCDKSLQEYEDRLGCVKKDKQLRKKALYLREHASDLSKDQLLDLAGELLELT